MEFFVGLAQGLAGLHQLVTAAALFFCWTHRRISRAMNLVVAGLVGMLASGIAGSLVPFVLSSGIWLGTVGWLATSLVGLLSWSLVVAGLARTLVDARRAISLVKDGRHDLE